MKYIYYFLFLILVFLVVPPTPSLPKKTEQAELQEVTSRQAFQFEGREYRYELSTTELKNTPSWDPLNTDPPLSIKKGIVLAKDGLKRFVKNTNGWRLLSIELKEVDSQKWIYNISFACFEPECIKKDSTSFYIWLKMDGSVVEPKIN